MTHAQHVPTSQKSQITHVTLGMSGHGKCMLLVVNVSHWNDYKCHYYSYSYIFREYKKSTSPPSFSC